MTRSDPIQIAKSGLCMGCGACVSAVGRADMTMAIDAAGFYRPRLEGALTASEQAVVADVCAGVALDHREAPDAAYHSLWGPIRSSWTGYSTDPEVRLTGSSGGVISGLLIWLLESGMVDFVVATRADGDDPIGNQTAALNSRVMIMGAAGSRYGPSSPLAGLEVHLRAGRRFAFVGKPCDVAGLRRMARHDPRIDELIPYKLAFFCAGVPSRKGTLAVLKALGVGEPEIAAFRYRGEGWPGLARATRRDGTAETMDYNSSWGNILNRHLQFRCKVCPDGTGEFADIVCADAWYGKDGYPDFEERDGRSLIVARTEQGARLLALAMAANAIVAEPLPVDAIEAMQPYQANRKRNVIARLLGLKLAGKRTPRYRHFRLGRLATGHSPLDQLRNLLGTYRRVVGRLRLD